MRTIIRTMLAVLLVALAACSPLGIKTEAQKIAASCATASASIKVLTAAHTLGKLDAKAAAGVQSAIDIVSPICGAEQAPTLDDVKREAFLAAISALQLAAAQANAGEVPR